MSTLRAAGPGIVESPNGIYIAWHVFEDYASCGSVAVRETVLYAINRYVNHLLYVTPVKRGQNIEVIEDVIPLYDVEVCVLLPTRASRVYLVPQFKKTLEIRYDSQGLHTDLAYYFTSTQAPCLSAEAISATAISIVSRVLAGVAVVTDSPARSVSMKYFSSK